MTRKTPPMPEGFKLAKGDRVIAVTISRHGGRLVSRITATVQRITPAGRAYVLRHGKGRMIFVPMQNGQGWIDLESTQRGVIWRQYRTHLERAP